MADTINKIPRQKLVNQGRIGGETVSLGASASVVIDLGPYVGKVAIQVLSISGTIDVKKSLDGKTFVSATSPASLTSTGITEITDFCRYIELVSGGGEAITAVVFGRI